MKYSFFAAGGACALAAMILPATAGERTVEKKVHQDVHVDADATFHTSKYAVTRQFNGDLTLERAVEIALRQNPTILAAREQIELTRGQYIQVRAAALPQITLSGSYEDQDPRLLKGGGESGGIQPTSPLSGTTLAAPSTIPATTSTAASAAGQPSTPVGTIGSGTAPSSGGITTIGTGSTSSGSTTTGGTGAAPAFAGVSRGAREVPNMAAASVLRSQAVTTTGGTTTTTNSSGSTTSQTTTSQPINISQLASQLGGQNGGVLQNDSWNVTVEVRQLLYSGGQVGAAIKIGKFTQDSAYFQLRDTVDTIISTVRTQFYSVLLDRALINVQEEAVNLLGAQLKDQQNRLEAGTVPRFNVLQAEVALANERPALISARNNYLVAQVQLARTLNLDPGPGGKPAFHCVGELGVPPQRLTLPDALQLARARRPFLKVQRQTMLIDAEEIKVELAGYKPQLDAHAGYELRNRSTSTEISDTVNGYFLGVTGAWAIFDGFATYGRVKEARARLEQARVNYDDSVHEVDLEVETSFANLEQARQTIASQAETVKEAGEAVRLARERLSAGAGTQLDVLNAQVQLTTARSTELQARGNYNIALAQFDLATATDTVYEEQFRDPMAKVEKGIFARLAESGLPKLPPNADARRDGKVH